MAASAAADTPSCSCSNITIMQLFHELKQRFPAVPDRVVSECIRKNFHDRHSCELILSRENQAYLLHSYPASLKMCAATSEPTSPLASNFHGLNLCDRFPARPRPRPEQDSAPCSRGVHPASARGVQRSHVDATWLDDAVSGLRANEARNLHVRAEPQQASCRDRFPYLDQLGRYFPSHFDQNFPRDPLILGRRGVHAEDDIGVQWDELDGKTVQNSNRWTSNCMHSHVGHYNAQQGDAGMPQVPVSSSGGGSTTSRVHHGQSRRPNSLNVASQDVFGMVEPRSAPVIPSDYDLFCSAIPGGDSVKPRPRCDGQSRGAQDPYKDKVVSVDVNCSLQHSPVGSSVNITSSSTEPKQRVRSTIELQPMPHYSSHDYWGRTKGQEVSSPRSYTSVNLTLRPPSSEPQPPIDIQSGGSSLTYSTSSYDPRQGYQSQLQIRIGPGASGSVTAMRTRAHDPVPRSPAPSPPRTAYSLARSGSLPDVNTVLSMISENPEDSVTSQEDVTTTVQLAAIGGDKLHFSTRALLVQQMDRKTRLQRELRREKDKLRKMQKEVQSMKKDLEHRELLKRRTTSLSLPVVTTVLQKVQQLRQDIQWLQEECKVMTNEVDDLNTDTRGRVEGERTPHWTCSACTYENHPLLDKCEQCDMPYIELGISPSGIATTAV